MPTVTVIQPTIAEEKAVKILHEKRRNNYQSERSLRSLNDFQRISEWQQFTSNRKTDGVRKNTIY